MSLGPPGGPGADAKMYKMYPEGSGGETDEYDPHANRKPEKPTTNLETFIHLLKGSLGTGILAMPKAFLNAGLVVGVVFTVLIGILCTYCLHVLVGAQYKLCKRFRVPVLNYPDSMGKALQVGPEWLRPMAKASAIIVDFFLIVYQLGICCVYIVFIADNLRAVTNSTMSVRLFMLMILVPLILINFIRNLKRLAPLSAVANLITFGGLAIIIYYLFEKKLDASKCHLAADIIGFPMFVGTTLFALEAVGVVIALENNMKTPKSFGGYFGVLNIAMAIIVFLYMFIGFFGYIRYGDHVANSITLSLQKKAGTTIAVQVIFSVAILITYALQSYVPVEIIWMSYLGPKLEKNSKKLLYEYLLRIGLVLLTFCLAVALPNLEVFITLFGAFCLSMLGITFPGLMDICTRWPDDLGRFKWRLWWDIILMIIGVFALATGTYTSVLRIVEAETTPTDGIQDFTEGYLSTLPSYP